MKHWFASVPQRLPRKTAKMEKAAVKEDGLLIPVRSQGV